MSMVKLWHKMGCVLIAEKVMQVNKKGEKITEYIVSSPDSKLFKVTKIQKTSGETDSLLTSLPPQTGLQLVGEWLSSNLIYKHD